MKAETARALRAGLAVAAAYFAFLLCAQFGFLAQLEERLGRDSAALRAVLTAMGLAGIAGGVLAAVCLRRRERQRIVRWGLLATAAAAAASLVGASAPALVVAAAGLGGALGFVTVAIAGVWGEITPPRRAGWIAGAGTGAAYALSNLPPLFSGPPQVRALAPALLCCVAAALAPRAATAEPRGSIPSSPWRFAGLVAAFAGLVAVDSAAFAHLQRAPELLAASWGSSAHQLRQGAVHFVAALLAGWILDRGGLRGLLVASAALFAAALPALGAPPSQAWAAVVYAAGISFYSAALVAAPAASCEPGVDVGARAAWLYGLAGWIGSALGVGAADAGAWRGVAGLAAAGFAGFLLVELAARRALATLTVAALVGGGVLGLASASLQSRRDAAIPDLVRRGRAVYLAEGCQHCHSQYVRPAGRDEEWWGPSRALDRRERPPTPGNRRLGPDLANVGLRRSDFWQATHLADPRAVSPGSRMPSYAHLFADGSGRGAALVAYLGSLGAGQERARAEAVASWRPDEPVVPASPERGAVLFARHCAPCHGAAGRGDGAVTAAIRRPSMDLTARDRVRVVAAAGESADTALARVLRFGLPPGSMPGHEWLSDAELDDLVAWLRQLRAGATPGAPAP